MCGNGVSSASASYEQANAEEVGAGLISARFEALIHLKGSLKGIWSVSAQVKFSGLCQAYRSIVLPCRGLQTLQAAFLGL